VTSFTRWWRSRPALPADGPVGTTVRAVVRAAPETLTLVRRAPDAGPGRTAPGNA